MGKDGYEIRFLGHWRFGAFLAARKPFWAPVAVWFVEEDGLIGRRRWDLLSTYPKQQFEKFIGNTSQLVLLQILCNPEDPNAKTWSVTRLMHWRVVEVGLELHH